MPSQNSKDAIFTFPFVRPPVSRDLGDGDDMVTVAGLPGRQLRLAFTSAEVGNGMAVDSGLLANQDGDLAVRLQVETVKGALKGGVSRFDDEGIRFVATKGSTFDVRDLVSGTERGDLFKIVQLGSAGDDRINFLDDGRKVYVNGGMGDDRITGGRSADFLVGGAGDDRLFGGSGNDSFIGGAGSDVIFGGNGKDTVIFAPATDGMDHVDLGAGMDVVSVSATAGSQIRLTFTSAEVGNGMARDSRTMTNQDGDLAVRLALEDGSDIPMDVAGRFDDEGIRFVASAGATFDVRDLVSGAARGDQFGVVALGTDGTDMFNERASMVNTYVNAGAGEDWLYGGMGNDFLVGGTGNDWLSGREGNDSMLGGAGNDIAVINLRDGSSDTADLGDGADMVKVMAEANSQVRVTFTSAEVGNGLATDAGTLANQDGALAVRLQMEDGAGMPDGAISRVDDEGIRLRGSAMVTFDVRDLVSGAARGDQFKVVQLGTLGNDQYDDQKSAEAFYVNAGQGDDWVATGMGRDFLVGGAGNDTLWGGKGADTLLGGSGDDMLKGGMGADTFLFVGSDGADNVADFTSGVDRIDLRSFAPVSVMQVAEAGGIRLDIDREGDGVIDQTILLHGVSALGMSDILM